MYLSYLQRKRAISSSFYQFPWSLLWVGKMIHAKIFIFKKIIVSDDIIIYFSVFWSVLNGNSISFLLSFFLTESDFLDFLVNYLRCTTCSYLQDAHSSLFESQGELNSKFLWSISEKIDFSYVKRFNSHREKWFKITFRFTMIFRP